VSNAQAKLRAEGAPLAMYSLARGVTAGAVSFSLLLDSDLQQLPLNIMDVDRK